MQVVGGLAAGGVEKYFWQSRFFFVFLHFVLKHILL